MPIKGYKDISGPQAATGAPNVKVSVSNPSPQPPVRSNPEEFSMRGLLFLGGLVGAFWLFTKARGNPSVGSLNVAREAGGIQAVEEESPVPESPQTSFESKNTVKRIAVSWKVDEGNADRVRATIATFLAEGRQDPFIGEVVAQTQELNGVSSDPFEVASFWQELINFEWPQIDDPDGIEHITSPRQLIEAWVKGEPIGPKGLDCDDKATALAVIYHHAGLNARVALVDTDGDRLLDHAGVLVEIPGTGELWAETVVPEPEVTLGWEPPLGSPEIVIIE